ncbi:MAG TPA: DUF1549 domain-containing protein [Pirellulales bacterium]
MSRLTKNLLRLRVTMGLTKDRLDQSGGDTPVWGRNLLFIAVCLGGAVALAASLSPVHTPAAGPDALRAPTADLHPSVERLNSSFRKAWDAAGIEPARRAPELLIVRRLSLALAGTVPSLAEIRQLESHTNDGRLAWWLNRLLEDRRSSDYLAERLARAYVGTDDGPFLIYRRRRFVSWLADEIHANRPYNEIVAQLIATDGIWTDKPATNFVTVTVQADAGKGPDANLLAARVSRAMLGVRLDCAECHDHPFRPWKQSDFQALAGFFGQTENSLRGIRDREGPAEIDDPVSGDPKIVVAGVPFAVDLLPKQGTPRQRLADWVTNSANKAFARATVNRVWALLLGRPLVEPIDDISFDVEAPRALTVLAEDFVAHEYDLRRLIEVIASSEAFQLDSRIEGDTLDGAADPLRPDAWSKFPITRLRPEQVVGSLLQASSLATLDYQSHILVRAARAIGQAEFLKHYGDLGADEFALEGGTVPQRLLLMNGTLVKEKTKENLLGNAATQIAALASTDEKAIEIAYLACLARQPTAQEQQHFVAKLSDSRGSIRRQQMEDIYWALVNSAEFSWNH